MVIPDPQNSGSYFLLDGHLRIEVLKELGVPTVECLIGRDEETYTYNQRINRLRPVQEHRMIARTMERGVPQERIAEALGIEVQSVRKKFRLLDGICSEVVETLKDTNCSMKVFDVLRRMSTLRQIEAADLMIGQNNFTVMFARGSARCNTRRPVSQATSEKERRGAKSQPAADSPHGMGIGGSANTHKVGRGQLRYRQSASDACSRSGVVRKGCASPEQLANAVHLKSESRPSARKIFATVAHLIPPGDAFEDFDDVLTRVRHTHDLAKFDDL